MVDQFENFDDVWSVNSIVVHEGAIYFGTSPNGGIYKYHQSKLVKIYDERIVKDYTEDQQHCPQYGEQFAREALVHGRLAYKVINGKVSMK